jgi:hypothetical protein
MKKTISLLVLLFSINVFALIAGPAKIVGTVKSFDDHTVTVASDKVSFQVPREFVGQKNLKTGEKIEILLSLEQAEKVKTEKLKTQKK